MSKRFFVPTLIVLIILCAVCALPDLALAATGQALPWDTPLKKLQDNITGPVAQAVSLMGIVAAGIMLVWGGEVNEFLRRIFMLVLVISVIMLATNILSDFGFSAATL